MNTFTTHTGQQVTGDLLALACSAVADDWSALAHAIYLDDDYASHVTDQEKAEILLSSLRDADNIRAGIIDNFTIWQRVNNKLTGNCVPLLDE